MKPLSSPFQLLDEAWKIYVKRLRSFLMIVAVPYLALLIATLLPSIVGFLAMFVAWLLVIISQIALFVAVRDHEKELTLQEAYGEAWKLLGAYVWVGALVFFIVMGGMLFFVIPGIVIAVMTLFAALAVVVDGDRGMSALLKSRELVRGHWWGVLGRWLCVVIAIIGAFLVLLPVALILGFLTVLTHLPFSSAFQFVLNILVTPFSVAYLFVLYRDLKAARGDAPLTSSQGTRTAFKIFGVLGVIVLVLGLLLVIVGAFFVPGANYRDMMQTAAPTPEANQPASPSPLLTPAATSTL